MGFVIKTEGAALAALEQREAEASANGGAAYENFKDANETKAIQESKDLGIAPDGISSSSSSSDSSSSDTDTSINDTGDSDDGFDFDAVGKLINLPADHAIAMFVAIGKATQPAYPRSGPLALEEIVLTDRF